MRRLEKALEQIALGSPTDRRTNKRTRHRHSPAPTTNIATLSCYSALLQQANSYEILRSYVSQDTLHSPLVKKKFLVHRCMTSDATAPFAARAPSRHPSSGWLVSIVDYVNRCIGLRRLVFNDNR
jgi:hypothetical protein